MPAPRAQLAVRLRRICVLALAVGAMAAALAPAASAHVGEIQEPSCSPAPIGW